MSSSKIIRNGEESRHSLNLEPLAGGVQRPDYQAFRAVQLGQEEPCAAEPEPEPYHPPPCIPEEEALERIRQAHAEGIEEGRRQAEESLAQVSEALAQALAAAGSLRAQVLHESEEDLLKLSAVIARRIMLRELTWDPGILCDMVRGALELASDAGEVVVRLNPEDYEWVARRPELAALYGDKKRISLKADPALPAASCLVETARGNIDAGLDSQLDQIVRRLAEEHNEWRVGHGDD